MQTDVIVQENSMLMQNYRQEFKSQFRKEKKKKTYKATSTIWSPHCEKPMSMALKKDVGATFLSDTLNERFTLCLPVIKR